MNGIQSANEEAGFSFVFLPLFFFFSPAACFGGSVDATIRFLIRCILNGNPTESESSSQLCSVTVTPKKKTIVHFDASYLQNGFFTPFKGSESERITVPFYPGNSPFPSTYAPSQSPEDASSPQSIQIEWREIMNAPEMSPLFHSYDSGLRPLNIHGCVPDGFTLIDALSLEHAQNSEGLVMTCPSCKESCVFHPVVQFGALPPLLIIQLKRFEFSVKEVVTMRNGEMHKERRFRRRKITDVVDFPLKGLDLNAYGTGDGNVYDCVCVCNHWGSDDYGHYYAYCRDFFDSSWYEYNDELVTPLREENVVTGNAYLLFYRKRGCDDALANAVLRQALEHPLSSHASQNHIPSKWLDKTNGDDPFEEDDTLASKRHGSSTISSGHFLNYSAATNVGKVSSQEFVQDIQGYKTKVSANMTKQVRMKDFQSLYISGLRKSNDSPSRTSSSENTALCTGETVMKPDLEYGRTELKENCWSENWNALWYLVVIIVLVVVVLYILIFYKYWGLFITGYLPLP